MYLVSEVWTLTMYTKKKLLTFKIILAWIYEPTFEAKTGRAKEIDWAKSAPQLDFSMRDLRKIYKRPDIVAVIR